MITLLFSILLLIQGIPVQPTQGGTISGILLGADEKPAAGVRVDAVPQTEALEQTNAGATLSSIAEATIGASARANPSGEQDPSAVEAIRRQVQGFKQNDRLKVKLHNGSEETGCLLRTEQDGFFIGWGPYSGTRILYGDIADVKKDKRGPLQKVLRGVVSVAAVGGAVFGVMKIGSNTPRTMAVKVPAALAVGYIGTFAAASQACR